MKRKTDKPTIQSITRAKAMRMLEFTELEYGDYLMQQGLGYLDRHLGDSIMSKPLSETTMFWNWWRMHWHNTDMLFVDEARNMSVAERRVYYRIAHSLDNFSYRPPKTVMADAFGKLQYKPHIIHTLE